LTKRLKRTGPNTQHFAEMCATVVKIAVLSTHGSLRIQLNDAYWPDRRNGSLNVVQI